MDGTTCVGVGQGSLEAKTHQEENSSNATGQRMDKTEKSQERLSAVTTGYVTNDLHTFMWLVDFHEENGYSGEIWFHKLCYYYKEGEPHGRRRLTASEIAMMNF